MPEQRSRPKNGRVIALANQKGGTGKTTTTVNLGIGLARLGKKVLLIDADPQGDLTTCLGWQDQDSLQTTLATVMGKIIRDEPFTTDEGILHHSEGVDLMPANIELSELEVSLVNAMSREVTLRTYVNEAKKNYDVVLIDCMPSLGMITINALAAADSVIIPVQAHYLPAKGMTQLIKTIGKVKRQINPALKVDGVLLTLVDGRTNLARQTVDTLRQLRQMYPEDELWLLMGTDMFLSLERWYHAADILSLAHIGAFDRVHPQPGGDLAAQKRHLEETYGADIAIIPNEHVLDLSSTQVRQALAQGGGQELVTDPVYGYIQRRGLYGVHTDLRRLTPDRLRPIALSYLKPKRMPHVLGTEQEAVRLARQYGADETQAGGRPAPRLHQEAGYGGAAGPVRPISHPAGRPGAARPEAAACQNRGGHRPGRVRRGRCRVLGHLLAHHRPCGHDPAGKDHLSGGLYRAQPGFSRRGGSAPGGTRRPGRRPFEGTERQHPGHAAMGQPRPPQHTGRPRLSIER